MHQNIYSLTVTRILISIFLLLGIPDFMFAQPGLKNKGKITPKNVFEIQEITGKKYLVYGETIEPLTGNINASVELVDSNFASIWQYNFTGNDQETIDDALVLSDGSIVVCGSTLSNDGNFLSPAKTSANAWAASLTAEGALTWVKVFGGTRDDAFTQVTEKADGSLLFAGTTNSNDVDVSGMQAGKEDELWLVTTNKAGDITSQKLIGGNNWESSPKLRKQTGGYVVTYEIRNQYGDALETWMLKLNENLVQTNQYKLDLLPGARLADLVVHPNTTISIGNLTPTGSSTTFVIQNFDSAFNKRWQKSAEVTKNIQDFRLSPAPANGLLVTGQIVGSVSNPSNTYAIQEILNNEAAYLGFIEWINANGEKKLVNFLGDNNAYFTSGLINSSGNLVLASTGECCNFTNSFPPSSQPTIYEIRPPSIFKGKFFLDRNANSQYDEGVDTEDLSRAQLFGTFTVNTISPDNDYSLGNREIYNHFFVPVDTKEYTAEITFNDNRDAARYIINPATKTFRFTDFDQKDSSYFALTPTNMESDLSIKIKSLTNEAAGLKGKYKITIQNLGNRIFDSVKVRLLKPASFQYLNATKSPANLYNDSIVWLLKNFDYGTTDSIFVEFMLPKPPVIAYGSIIVLESQVESFPEDIDLFNNSDKWENSFQKQSAAVKKMDIKITPKTRQYPGQTTEFVVDMSYAGDIDTLYAGLKIVLLKMRYAGSNPTISSITADTLVINEFNHISGQNRSFTIKCQLPLIPEIKYGEKYAITVYVNANLLDYTISEIPPGRYMETLEIYYPQNLPSSPEETDNIAWLKSLESDNVRTVGKNVLMNETKDGKILVASTVEQTGKRQLLLQKIDKEGVLEWQKMMLDSTLNDLKEMKIQSDGSVVFLAQKQYPIDTPIQSWAAVTSVGANGDFKWTTDIEKNNSTDTNRTHAVPGGFAILPDNKIIVSGYNYFPQYISDTSIEVSWLAKLDAQGNIIVSRKNRAPNYIARLATMGPVVDGWIKAAGSQVSNNAQIIGSPRFTPHSQLFNINTNDLSSFYMGFIQELDYFEGIKSITQHGDLIIVYGSSLTGSNTKMPLIKAIRGNMGPVWEKYLNLSSKTSAELVINDSSGLLATVNLEEVNTGLQIPGYVRLDSSGNLIALRVFKPIRMGNAEMSFPNVISLGSKDYIFGGNGTARSINKTPVLTSDNRINIIKINKNNQIKGLVFADLNNNGQRDNLEPGIIDASINISYNTETKSYKSDSSGQFTLEANKGRSVVRIINNSSMYRPSPDSIVVNMADYMQTDTITFRMVPLKDSTDLQAELLPLNIARPGFESQYQIVIKNAGTKPISNGVIKLAKDSRQTFQSTSRPYSSVTADSIIWNIGALLPESELRWNVNFKNAIPPALTNSDSLQLTLAGSPIINDGSPANNTAVVIQPVRGSYDPNDKTEVNNGSFTPEQLSRKESLTYLVRFQNTGNDTAFRVIILDTLDSKLDPSTIEIKSASHPYTWELIEGNICRWTFKNILLPDSNTNEKLSHGFIAFTVKPRETIKIGESIRNTAGIYFDFNPAVLTNTAITTFQARIVTSVRTVNNPVLSINAFPNPTSGLMTLQMQGGVRGNLRVIVYDMSGRLMTRIDKGKVYAQSYNLQLDLTSFKSGVYYIDVMLDDAHVPFRVLKTN